MREKRIDIYLAKAGFTQVLLVAFGSACVTQLVEGKIWETVITGSITVIASIIAIRYYKKATQLSEKNKKKAL